MSTEVQTFDLGGFELDGGVTPEEAETLIAFTPMGRRAEPEEVSGIVTYLASDEASFTVGGTFTVDGGMAAL